MCGIAGLVTSAGYDSWAQDVLDRMTDSLEHRGPDNRGTVLRTISAVASDSGNVPLGTESDLVGGTAVAVGLGHRRLSIVDVDGSPQPCFSEQERVAVTFNGEIYNYRALRRELVEAGHQFKTDGDTEVLVHAWEEWGRDMVHRLDGMFAFVVADFANAMLFGAVDPMGQKPLYLYDGRAERSDRSEVLLAFASEPRAFCHLSGGATDLVAGISLDDLHAYLLHDYMPGDRTPYQGVHRMRPGSWFEVEFRDAALSEAQASRPWSSGRYWVPRPWERNAKEESTSPAIASKESRLARVAEEFLELFGDAVEKRLMSDVPLGVFLSGGLDSTLLVGVLRERLGDAADIKTFSIGFRDRSFDESSQARATARVLATQHHEKIFDEEVMLTVLPQVISHLDEPFADPSILPFSLLCREARKHVTVALGGDGGDELFAGYDPFRAVGPGAIAARLRPVSKVGARLASITPAGDGNLPLAFKLERFLRGAKYSSLLRPAVWMGAFSPHELAEMLARATPADSDVSGSNTRAEIETRLLQLFDAEEWEIPGEVEAQSPWHTAMIEALGFFQKRYLPDDILVKVDRGSMMHSLEVRSPFLDRRLVEWANRLPMEFLYERSVGGLGRGKVVARKALEILAARAKKPWSKHATRVNERSKKGFGIPVRRWLRGPLASVARESASLALQACGVDRNSEGARELLASFYVRGPGKPKELWSLFLLGQWLSSALPEVGEQPEAGEQGALKQVIGGSLVSASLGAE